jgi:hypothetical protein
MHRLGDDDVRAKAHASDDVAKRNEHDDVEAAIDFLAERADRTAASPLPPSDATTVDLARYRARRMRQRLLGILDGVFAAIERRDVERVVTLLDDPEAYRCVPARVREEAIVIAQLPAGALRAPIRLYRYQYLLQRLDDEPLESPLDPAQLALEFTPTPPPQPLHAKAGVRELSFTDHALRDRQAPEGGPPRGGHDRRRTGAR